MQPVAAAIEAVEHAITHCGGVRYAERPVRERWSGREEGAVARVEHVKLTAAADGSALGLSSDSNGGGVRAFAKRSDSFVEVKGTDGQVRIIKP